jgi:hypothetical protein
MARATSRWISCARSSLGLQFCWQNWDHVDRHKSKGSTVSLHNSIASFCCPFREWEPIMLRTSFRLFVLPMPSPGGTTLG